MKLLAVTLAMLLTLCGLSTLAAAKSINGSEASYVVVSEYGEAGSEATPSEEGVSGESGQPDTGVITPEMQKEQPASEGGSEEPLKLPESPLQQEEKD